MDIIALAYAFIASTIFILSYIKVYQRYFYLRKYYILGVIFLLCAVYMQFLLVHIDSFPVGYIGLISFVSYPLSFVLIFKTSILNAFFLSLNAILKIYIAFVFFGALYAQIQGIQFDVGWLSDSYLYHLSQGHAYVLSIGSLFIVDHFLLKDKLAYFFKLKRNLIFIFFIQLILLVNMAWMSLSSELLPFVWYNNVLLLISFSVEIIYFLLRLLTVNTSYFSTYKTHTITLRKQLSNQLEHYKNYEAQVNEFAKFKHDYDKVLSGITNLLSLKHYDAIKDILDDSSSEISNMHIHYKRYSNHLILDALLNDYANRFKRLHVEFDAQTYITLHDMNELKLIKLFSNILENAYEALALIDDPLKRRFHIQSEVLDPYIKISFVNTMIDDSLLDKPHLAKKDKMNRGYGQKIIFDILNEHSGFSNNFTTTDNNLKFYHLEIFLPFK